MNRSAHQKRVQQRSLLFVHACEDIRWVVTRGALLEAMWTVDTVLGAYAALLDGYANGSHNARFWRVDSPVALFVTLEQNRSRMLLGSAWEMI